MPADRFLHPRLGHSRKVNALTHLEYRVWTQYQLSADDFGVLLLSPTVIQADNDALDREPRDVIAATLHRIVEVGLTVSFDHQGQPYMCQLDWHDWQKIRYPRETYRPCPPPEILQQCSRNTSVFFRKFHPHPSVSPARARTREMANGKRLMANGKGREERFERFWAAYPRKVGKDAAWREWKALAPGDDLTNRMIAEVETQKQSRDWRKDDGQYIPHPKTWLHQGRWKDELPKDTPSTLRGRPGGAIETIQATNDRFLKEKEHARDARRS